MAEEDKTKYAAEIWELIQLFSRMGRTVYGLLALLVAWVLLLRTGRETLSAVDVVDGLWLPSIDRWWPFRVAWFHPTISWLVVAGALGLVIWWLVHSRLLAFVWALVRHGLKPAVFVLGYVSPFLVLPLNVLLMPLTIPMVALVRRARRRASRQRWMDRRKTSLPNETDEQRAQAWTKHIEELESDKGKDAVENALTDGPWEASPWFIVNAWMALTGRVLRHILSGCRVGLAPITPQSYTEEFRAGKLPLQVFARAMTRIRGDLGELAILDRVRFFELPPSARLHQFSQAARYAWLFDTDVLLWGTYKLTDEKSISLNVFRRFEASRTEGDDHGAAYQRRFFPSEVLMEFPALSFDQDDDQEVYIVLVVAEILALQSARRRWDIGWRRAMSQFQVLDRASLRGRDTIQEMVLRVIPPILQRLGDDALPETTSYTARRAVVDLAGQWIGSLLSMDGTAFKELSRRRDKNTTLEQLRTLAEQCVRLQPGAAFGHYRLGALQILTGKKPEALASFRAAGELERRSFLVDQIGAQVAADMTDFNLNDDEDIELAVWAAHSACALNTGSEYAKTQVRESIDEKRPRRLRYLQPGAPDPVAIAVIKEMLAAQPASP